MVYDSLVEKLESDYDETVKHLEAGNQRIKAWYSDDFESPEGFDELEKPPHQYLLEQAAKLIEFASGELTDPRHRMSSPINNAELILYGVGFERIGSAVHLKLDHDEFIESLDQHGETPNFWSSWDVLLDDLAGKIDEEQVDVVKLTQEIVWEHRNNEAHLGFHRHRSFHLSPILLNVAAKLMRHYSEAEFETLDVLLDRAAERNDPGRNTTWKGEFDPDGQLD